MKDSLFDSHINQVQHFDRVGNWCMSSLSDSNCNFRDVYVSQQKKQLVTENNYLSFWHQ